MRMRRGEMHEEQTSCVREPLLKPPMPLDANSYGSNYDEISNVISQESKRGSDGDTSHTSVSSESENCFPWRVWISLVIGAVLYVVSLISFAPLAIQFFSYRIARDKYNFHYNDSSNVKCGNDSTEGNELIDNVQKEASQIILEMGLASGIPACFTCLLVGSYSDYIGRKPILVASVFGGFIRFLNMTLIVKYDWNIRMCYIGAAIDGMLGSYFTLILATTAIITDITPNSQNRALNFAVIEGLMLPTAAAAQIGVGYLIRYDGFFIPLVILTVLLVISLLTIIFVLPETVQWKRMVTLNPKVHFKKVVSFYFHESRKQRRLYLLGLGSFVVMALVNIGRMSVETLYELSSPVCWNSVEIGIYSAIKTVGQAIVTVLFMKLMKNRLSLEYTGVICAVSGIAGAVIFGLSKSTPGLYLAALVGILYLGCIPIPRALLSQLAPPTEQGALFSGLSLVDTFSSLVSTFLFTFIYNNTIDFFKGAVFMVIAGIIFTVVIFLVAFRLSRADASLSDFQILVEPGMDDDASYENGTVYPPKDTTVDDPSSLPSK